MVLCEEPGRLTKELHGKYQHDLEREAPLMNSNFLVARWDQKEKNNHRIPPQNNTFSTHVCQDGRYWVAIVHRKCLIPLFRQAPVFSVPSVALFYSCSNQSSFPCDIFKLRTGIFCTQGRILCFKRLTATHNSYFMDQRISLKIKTFHFTIL